MNINDHRDELAQALLDAHRARLGFDPIPLNDCAGPDDYTGPIDELLASPALARLLAAARDEARAPIQALADEWADSCYSPGSHTKCKGHALRRALGETPADVLDGTGVTANTWQSAARRLADENRALIAAFDELRRRLNEIRGRAAADELSAMTQAAGFACSCGATDPENCEVER